MIGLCVGVGVGVYVFDCLLIFTRVSIHERVRCKGRERSSPCGAGAALVLPAKSQSGFIEEIDQLTGEIQQLTV